MRAVLTLQIPSPDWRRGHVLVASSDRLLIREFCRKILEMRESDLDGLSGDAFERELARINLDQLRARLTWILREDD